MWWLYMVSAMAAPTISLDGDVIVGVVEVAAAPDVVRERIADPTWVNAVDAGNTDVTVADRAEGCLVLDYLTTTTFATVRFRVRQCPTLDGVVTSLMQSDDFSAYQTSWVVRPNGVEGGAVLVYRQEVRTRLPVPAFIVRRQSKRHIASLLARLEERFAE